MVVSAFWWFVGLRVPAKTPFFTVCIIIAISARMNIRGINVSFGANPHSIGRKEEE